MFGWGWIWEKGQARLRFKISQQHSALNICAYMLLKQIRTFNFSIYFDWAATINYKSTGMMS